MRHWLAGVLTVACSWAVWGQVAILHIQIVEGEGAVHAAGSRSQRSLAVEITDELGRPVAGAVVTFTLPEDGPGGLFTNGLRTEVVTADARGRAAVRGFQLNRNPGRFAIRIIASREQARAGTISFQYIAGPERHAAAAARAKRGRKWLVLVLAAGAAVGGIAAGTAGHGCGTAPSTPTAPAIGTPVITVGKP